MTRHLSTLSLLFLLAACGQSHSTVDAGARSDAGPPPCDAPSVNVIVRTDYEPGTEVVSIVLELNDMIIDGVGVAVGDDLTGGVMMGPACGVLPRSRITVRILDARGAEVTARQVLLEAPEDGSTVEVIITR